MIRDGRHIHSEQSDSNDVCAMMQSTEPAAYSLIGAFFFALRPPCGPRDCLQSVEGAPGGLSGTTWRNLIAALGLGRS